MTDVTYIVPVYNAAQSLPRCIDSILAQQNVRDYEAIFIDDGSTDESGKILAEYAGKNAHVTVISQKNSGVSAARNAGLEKARGKYIQFLDADDWIPDHSTVMMMHAAEKYQADLVVGNFYRVSGSRIAEKGSIKQDGPLTLQEYAEFMIESPADFYYGVLWNKLYRRDIIVRNKLRMNEDLNYCEDFIFNLEYLMHVKTIVPLQLPVYYYVKTPGSLASGIPMAKIAATKINVFSYYDNFYKNVLDEKEYNRDRLAIASYLTDAAGDQFAVPFMPGTKKLGNENVKAEYQARQDDLIVLSYYMRKLFDKYLLVVSEKYSLKLDDIKVLAVLFNCDSTDVTAALADFTGLSSMTVNSSLRRLVSRKYIQRISAGGVTSYTIGEDAQNILEDVKYAARLFYDTLLEKMDEDEKSQLKSMEEKMMKNIRAGLGEYAERKHQG